MPVVEVSEMQAIDGECLAAHNVDKGAVLVLQRERREARGGFEKRLRLLWTE